MNVDQYSSGDSRRHRRTGGLRLLLATLLLAGTCVLVAEPKAMLHIGHALLELGAALASNP